jgi:type VI secretion system protein ImpC
MFEDKNYQTRAEIDRRIAEIDEIVGRQLDAILHHPEFKALEAAWRGLFYLVNRKQSFLRVKVKVLSVAKRELSKDFDRWPELRQTQLHKQIYSDIYRRGSNHSYNLLVGAYEFDHRTPDMTLLENLAAIAAKAHAPFIAAVSPAMFGRENFDEVAAEPDISNRFRSPEYDRWNEFRSTAAARYAGLCLPRFLLRRPHKIDGSFIFDESAGKRDLPWGNAAFAFAGCVARAFDKKGWLGPICGPDGDGAVEGLISLAGDANRWGPTDSLDADLSRQRRALSNHGFISLVDEIDGKIHFFDGQSANRPVVYESERATAFSRAFARLENIIAVSRFAVCLMNIRLDNYYFFKTPQDLQAFGMKWLGRYYRAEDDAPDEVKAARPLREFNLTIEKSPERPADYRGVLFIRPAYLLDDPKLALRAEIYLPEPGSTDE